MPIATIHVPEGRYDERRLGHVSKAVQDALISVLKTPSDDFFQVIHVSGRPKETCLTLLKELNAQIAERAGISPDDLVIQLSEGPGENYSLGQGLAQRAFISAGSVADGEVPITPASPGKP